MKLLRIVLRHFRFLLAINVVWSTVLLGDAFASTRLTTAILLIAVGKIVGYGLSILIEKLFYAKQREYYFKNVGIAYRQLFACLFAIDAILLMFMAFLWSVIRNFT